MVNQHLVGPPCPTEAFPDRSRKVTHLNSFCLSCSPGRPGLRPQGGERQSPLAAGRLPERGGAAEAREGAAFPNGGKPHQGPAAPVPAANHAGHAAGAGPRFFFVGGEGTCVCIRSKRAATHQAVTMLSDQGSDGGNSGKMSSRHEKGIN